MNSAQLNHQIRPFEADADAATLTLDDSGMVCDCNPAAEALLHYGRGELLLRHVSTFLPQFSDVHLMQDGQPNPSIRFLCRIGQHFRAVTHEGAQFASEIFLNVLDSAGQGRLSLILRPASEGVHEASAN